MEETTLNHHKRFKNELITLCEQFADKAAITYMREEGANTYTTYKEILAGCIEIKEILDGVGITAGDRVAIVSPHLQLIIAVIWI